MTRGCSPCSRRRCRRWWTARRPGPGSRSMTSPAAGCWTVPWPACRRRMPPGSGTPAPAGGGCGSRSTRPLTRGRTRGVPRAGSTSTTARAIAGAPARPRPAGSTSSPPPPATCGPRGPRSSTCSAPPRRPGPRRRSPGQEPCCAACTRRARSGAAPLFVFDAGYSAAALTDGLAGLPGARPGQAPGRERLLPGRRPWPGRNGRPARRGPEVHCLEPEALAAAAEGRGSRGRKKPLPRPPSRTRP